MKKLVSALAASAFTLSLYSAAMACPGMKEGKTEASSTFAKKDSKKSSKSAKVAKKSSKKVVKVKAKAKPAKVSSR